MSAARMPRDASEPLDVTIALDAPARRAARDADRAARVPAGLEQGRVHPRDRAAHDPLLPHRQGRQHRSSATRGCCWRPTRHTSRTSRSSPEWQRHKLATRLLLDAGSRGIVARGATGADARGARRATTARKELYRRFGFAPAGMRKLYYRDPDEDGLIMWAHDIDSPAYVTRLASIEAEVPGTHVRRRRGVDSDGGVTVDVDPRPASSASRRSCDETAAAVVMGGDERAVVGRVEPGRPPRPLRRRRARDRGPGARRDAHAGRRAGDRRGGHRRRPHRRGRRHRRPRASSGRCSSA